MTVIKSPLYTYFTRKILTAGFILISHSKLKIHNCRESFIDANCSMLSILGDSLRVIAAASIYTVSQKKDPRHYYTVYDSLTTKYHRSSSLTVYLLACCFLYIIIVYTKTVCSIKLQACVQTCTNNIKGLAVVYIVSQ